MVIIGGWAHRLYRLHHFAQPLDYEPLATFDTDVAVPVELPRRGEDIRERLVANGFTEELLGETRPPVIHYRLIAGGSKWSSLAGGHIGCTGFIILRNHSITNLWQPSIRMLQCRLSCRGAAKTYASAWLQTDSRRNCSERPGLRPFITG